MSLLNALRSAVKVADKVTKPLQCTVTLARYTGETGYGDKTYAAPVQLRAIVDWSSRQVRTSTGLLTVSRAVVTFLDVAALASATGGTGMSEEDQIVMQDGSTGPILDLSGFVDAGTGNPIATEAVMG